MINYLSKFSARLSELAEPIRELCKDKVPFNWGPEHQAAFKLMKREIIRAPVLAYYNPKKETILQTDASIKGTWSMLATRPQASILREQSINRNPEGIRSHRIRIFSCGLGNGEVPSLLICKPFYSGDRPETPRGDLI